MKREKEVFDPTVDARKVLELMWAKSQLRGRCWGRGKVNPYKGTNITIALEDELVTISRNGKKEELIVHQFQLAKSTKLGDKVIEILQTANLRVIKRAVK